MTLVTIILLIIGIIAIFVSFSLTKDDVQQQINPNLKTELTEADKKHLRKITDNYMNEYSKSKVRDNVSQKISDAIDEEVKKTDKLVSGKVDENINRISDAGNSEIEKLDQRYEELNSDIEKNKNEVNSFSSVMPMLVMPGSISRRMLWRMLTFSVSE